MNHEGEEGEDKLIELRTANLKGILDTDDVSSPPLRTVRPRDADGSGNKSMAMERGCRYKPSGSELNRYKLWWLST